MHSAEYLSSQTLFKAPFTCMLAGPSQSGKTSLLINILQNMNTLIDRPPTRIVYCYSAAQDAFSLLGNLNIEFVQGLPRVEEFDPNVNNMIILDDLMSACEREQSIQTLFTVHSHHSNISVFILTQNLFSKGPCARTISLNCRYLIVFNNPRDGSQIRTLGSQMYPDRPTFLTSAYKDAIESQEFGYLFIDNTQSQSAKYRVSTFILPNESRIFYRIK